jgi:hypothetical protein
MRDGDNNGTVGLYRTPTYSTRQMEGFVPNPQLQMTGGLVIAAPTNAAGPCHPAGAETRLPSREGGQNMAGKEGSISTVELPESRGRLVECKVIDLTRC